MNRKSILQKPIFLLACIMAILLASASGTVQAEVHGQSMLTLWRKATSAKYNKPEPSKTFTCPGRKYPVHVSRQSMAEEIVVASGLVAMVDYSPLEEYFVIRPTGVLWAKLIPAPWKKHAIKYGSRVRISIQKASSGLSQEGDIIEEGTLIVLGNGRQFQIGDMIVQVVDDETAEPIRESLHYQRARLVITITSRDKS